jgi:hypothetical protein
VGPDSVNDLTRQVQPTPTLLNVLNHSQTLFIMTVATSKEAIQSGLARVSERRMPQIVRQRDDFHEVLIKPQGASDDPPYLCNFQCVTETGRVVVAGGCDEDLRFGSQSPEGVCVNDPIAIPLVRSANVGLGFGLFPAGGLSATHRPRRQESIFCALEALADRLAGHSRGVAQL